MIKQRWLSWPALPLLPFLVFPSLGQHAPQKTPKVPETALAEDQLPAFAATLVMSLATEARSFTDVALRSRVLARAAGRCWLS